MAQVIVVGGGLAGLSAAHTVLERGGNVLVLEKVYSSSFPLASQPECFDGWKLNQGHFRHQWCLDQNSN